MSSTYDALCLSHNPALPLLDSWALTADEALAAARTQHTGCNLLLARYSGGLVELGCPPHSDHPHHTRWVQIEWLQLALAAADQDPRPWRVERAVRDLERVHRCWRPERLDRIRRLLLAGLEPR